MEVLRRAGRQIALSRRTALSLMAVGLVLPILSAEPEPISPEEDIPELKALDLRLPTWSKSLTLRGGAGYKDNLLLNNAQREESSYLLSGFDLFLFRLPEQGRQFHFFLSGDDIRYLSGDKVRKEDFVAAQAQFKKDFGNGWQSAVTWQYVFQDQVFDASLTETNLGTAKVQGHTFAVKPWLARYFSGGFRVEAELPLTRQYFLAPLDDYWEGGPKLTMARDFGGRSDLALSYILNRRFYDTRAQTDAQGNVRDGSSLNYQQHEFDLVWQHYWDDRRRWRSQTRADFQLSEDNGAGYFNYTRSRLSGQLRWRFAGWELRADLRLSRYEYSLQRGSGAHSGSRYRNAFGASWKAEKDLGKHLKAFATYEFEHVVGNQLFDTYDVNSAGAGLEWEF